MYKTLILITTTVWSHSTVSTLEGLLKEMEMKVRFTSVFVITLDLTHKYNRTVDRAGQWNEYAAFPVVYVYPWGSSPVNHCRLEKLKLKELWLKCSSTLLKVKPSKSDVSV